MDKDQNDMPFTYYVNVPALYSSYYLPVDTKYTYYAYEKVSVSISPANGSKTFP